MLVLAEVNVVADLMNIKKMTMTKIPGGKREYGGKYEATKGHQQIRPKKQKIINK